MTRPGGGFVLWIALPESCDTAEFHAQALKQGVGFMPGSLFSAQRRYTNCLRITYGQVWNVQMEQAIATLGHLFKAVEADAC